MQTKKLSFSEIKGVLSRDEMRKIMAGSGESAYCSPTSMNSCPSGLSCKWYNDGWHCRGGSVSVGPVEPA